MSHYSCIKTASSASFSMRKAFMAPSKSIERTHEASIDNKDTLHFSPKTL